MTTEVTDSGQDKAKSDKYDDEETENDEELTEADVELSKKALSRVRGIGDATAETLVRDHGVRDVGDLREEMLNGNKAVWETLSSQYYGTIAVQLDIEPHDPPEEVGSFYFSEVPWEIPDDTHYESGQDFHDFIHNSDKYGYVRAGFWKDTSWVQYEGEGGWKVSCDLTDVRSDTNGLVRVDVNKAYLQFIEWVATGAALDDLETYATRPADEYDLDLSEGDTVKITFSDGEKTDIVKIDDVSDGQRFRADDGAVVFTYHRSEEDGVYAPIIIKHPDLVTLTETLERVEFVERDDRHFEAETREER